MQNNYAGAPYGGGGYGYYPGSGRAYPPPGPTGKGLAISAVVVAGSGLMSCWIPFLNVYAFVACAVTIGLAIGALIRAQVNPRPARVLAIVSVGIAVLSVALAWAVNSWAIDAWNNSPGSPKSLRESATRTAGPEGVDCSTGISPEGAGGPGLYGDGSGSYEICFDLPQGTLGDNSRVILAMEGVLEELYWQP